MTTADFKNDSPLDLPAEGRLGWEAPSNIALVKYWGKHGMQLPANPSISFTLSHAKTTTALSFEQKEQSGDGFDLHFSFEGKAKPEFEPKIQQFFERAFPYLPFLKKYRWKIDSQNSFPHSSGIASSASAMAALSLCLISVERRARPEMSETHFTQKASFLARLGSGSAARSIQGPLMQWGTDSHWPGSSDLFAQQIVQEVHPVFKEYCDCILLVHQGKKGVSSTAGHGLMHGHSFADPRFQQARKHMGDIKGILQGGDLEAFIALVELEALSLHAMMMSSSTPYLLMLPGTVAVLHEVWQFRKETSIPLGFTLDAGANVHLLYPAQYKQKVEQFIDEKLVVYCEKQQYIRDSVGSGAKPLEEEELRAL
jgi:diphosphomevalonate decarboxylase